AEEEEARRQAEEEAARREAEEAEARRKAEEEEARRLAEEEAARREAEEAEARRNEDHEAPPVAGNEASESDAPDDDAARADDLDESGDDQQQREVLTSLVLAELDDRRSPDSSEHGTAADVEDVELTDLPDYDGANGHDDDAAYSDTLHAELDSARDALDLHEDDLRRDIEAMERQQMLEEEARKAVERAEREARESAEHEARAIAESTRRAQEERARRELEEAARRTRLEAERKAREKEERKHREEEARRRAENARLESERQAREAAFAKQRAEQEQRDRQKAARKALLDARRRTAWGRLQPYVIGLGVVLALLLGGLHLVPMSFYVPSVEHAVARRLGEPVAIGELHVALFPLPKITLDDVKIGRQLDVRIRTVEVQPDFDSLFRDTVHVKKVELLEASAGADALPRIMKWFERPEGQGNLEFRRIVLKRTHLSVPDVDVPAFDADVLLGVDGSFKGGDLELSDRSLKATLLPGEGPLEISLEGRGWTPTYGPPLNFDEITAKATVDGQGITFTGVDAMMYGGVLTGTARVQWGSGWTAKGDFSLERVQASPFMGAVTKDARVAGELQSQGSFEMSAARLGGLYDAPDVRARFTLRKGDIDGVDMVRALQTPHAAEGVQGGKTRVDELRGSLSVSKSRYAYRDLRMDSGLLHASGAFTIDPSQKIGGRIQMELRSPTNTFRGRFDVGGDLKAIVLKP
ncbi:MAG: hypothetical protein GC151_15980, partial [Betaproteobacteria bacterium]|nr:hypothetical protein [Betaproteobacteria bacterium]